MDTIWYDVKRANEKYFYRIEKKIAKDEFRFKERKIKILWNGLNKIRQEILLNKRTPIPSKRVSRNCYDFKGYCRDFCVTNTSLSLAKTFKFKGLNLLPTALTTLRQNASRSQRKLNEHCYSKANNQRSLVRNSSREIKGCKSVNERYAVNTKITT